ncbi:recombinase family protein [Sphingobium sp. DC-2]|uniref:recombinase family protein n=1 Tax=Sphingobium sp. DC-2 TaxID=1303256 RepID=UPI001ED9B093|nr:recombinase family protein [Sphingobium sp. DC-2]
MLHPHAILPPLEKVESHTTMRTLIYARYSSQLQNSRSIEDQIAVCRERAEREGWQIIDIFTDYAISGAAGIEEGQRPGLNAMLARVESGGIDQVLAEATDRIARHQGDAFAIRERLNYAGARLFTLSDGEVDDITGTIKGLMDARFRKELGAKIKRGQRGTVSQGRVPAGLAYGYRTANQVDSRGNLLRGLRVIDEEQAAIVRRIFREVATGRSTRAIAASLNAEGVPGPRGGEWRGSTIHGDRQRMNGLIQNQIYIGKIVHNRTSKVTDPRTRKTLIKPNPESEWMSEDAPDLRIIDDELWNAAQAARAKTEGVTFRKAKRPKRLLSGIGRCGCCGGPWNVIGDGVWACGSRRDGGNCTNNRTIRNHLYEQRVLAALQEGLLDPRYVAIFVKEYHEDLARRTAEIKAERSVLERKLRNATDKVKRLAAALAEGAGEFMEVREIMTKAAKERADAEEQLANLEALPVIALHPKIADDYREQIRALSDALAGNAEAQLEAIPRLRALIDTVTITPAKTPRGVEIEVSARLRAIIGLASGRPLDDELMFQVERVKGIEPSS